MKLTARHRKTLEAIFRKPTRPDIRWSDVERLFVAVGSEISEGGGSRVRIKLGNQVKTFHRPHPSDMAKRYAVEAAREFLKDHGIEP
ncbi:MAG TPA: type II toxin-antitoxin system HicA family toxin [Rhodothermales bacterium]|nr:type II toxin-antitoxin system HicA family toxin [Rhodothermales bacterium]